MRNYLLSAADRARGARAGIRGSEIESVAKGKEFEILKIFFSLEVLVFRNRVLGLLHACTVLQGRFSQMPTEINSCVG